MATGDNTVLASGELDRGLGRLSYFSGPRFELNRRVGDAIHDNTFKITKSRNLLQ